jgi:excisionase family DNA binding protein
MTTENPFTNNPLAAIYAKVDSVEKQVQDLHRLLEQPKPSLYNPHERLTRQQVRQQYKVSYGTIHNLMKSGKLAYEKVGRKTLFRREDVERVFSGKGGTV